MFLQFFSLLFVDISKAFDNIFLLKIILKLVNLFLIYFILFYKTLQKAWSFPQFWDILLYLNFHLIHVLLSYQIDALFNISWWQIFLKISSILFMYLIFSHQIFDKWQILTLLILHIRKCDIILIVYHSVIDCRIL